jgi:fusion and transport protein UGO1
MSTNAPRRGLVNELGQLPSWVCPGKIFVPTVLHSIISPVIIHSTPLVLSSQFSIDPVRTPAIFSVASFLSQAVELFVKLPLETVLRRGQMSVLTSPPYYTGKELDTVVDIGPYSGPIGTMWMIAREEGVRDDPDALKFSGPVTRTTRKPKVKQGQGVEGLWRGWRVGMWGLVGMWGAAAMGGGGGGEF